MRRVGLFQVNVFDQFAAFGLQGRGRRKLAAAALLQEQGSDMLVHFGDERFLERYRRYKAHIADWRQRNESFFTVLEVERNMMFIILSLIGHRWNQRRFR